MLRRAIGFATIVIAVIIVLVLLPRHGEKNESKESAAIPVVAVPIGAASQAASAASGPAIQTAGKTTGIGTTPMDAAQTLEADQANHEPGSETVQQDVGGQKPEPTSSGQSGDQAQQIPRERPRTDTSTPQDKSQEPRQVQHQPAKSQPSTTVAGGAYYVQVGSFADNSNASDVLTKLKHLGFSGRVHAASVAGQTYYRVQAGPYADEGAADKAQRRLLSKGYKGSRVITP